MNANCYCMEIIIKFVNLGQSTSIMRISELPEIAVLLVNRSIERRSGLSLFVARGEAQTSITNARQLA